LFIVANNLVATPETTTNAA